MNTLLNNKHNNQEITYIQDNTLNSQEKKWLERTPQKYKRYSLNEKSGLKSKSKSSWKKTNDL